MCILVRISLSCDPYGVVEEKQWGEGQSVWGEGGLRRGRSEIAITRGTKRSIKIVDTCNGTYGVRGYKRVSEGPFNVVELTLPVFPTRYRLSQQDVDKTSRPTGVDSRQNSSSPSQSGES